MKYLITGGNGQLAQAFIKRFKAQSIDFSPLEKSQLDIADRKTVSAVVASYKPNIIINCAAYNDVERAEREEDVAFAVNAIGPRNLAETAAKRKAILVHFGSDYVFDGAKESGLYTENDLVNPLNVYGKSKLAGERNVLNELDRCLILRLSWVFGVGKGKQNFIHKILERTEKDENPKFTCDEFSVPTWTDTVADVTLQALEQGVTGLYHLTSTGFCSRYELAKFVLGGLGIKKFIKPVNAETFNPQVKRPKFSAMSNAKIAGLLNMPLPPWEDGVRTFLREGALTHEQ
jgi:dTDP-4-dehydrorhamnose reductase